MRPALFSLRAQIDMILCWLYFKDHRVEWQLVCDAGEGFKLKTEVIKYLETYYDGFARRFSLLKTAKTRSQEDPYRLLSAHVHSQSITVIPTIIDLKSLVATQALCNECIKLQAECVEYVSDVLLACFAKKWSSLPVEIVDAARVRLPKSEAKIVFG